MNKLYHAIIGVEELSDDTDVENEAEVSDDINVDDVSDGNINVDDVSDIEE